MAKKTTPRGQATKAEKPVQRWTAKRRTELVLKVLRGETSPQEAARKHGLTVAEIETWQDRFLAGAQNALRARPRDEVAARDEEIKRLKQKVGELVLDLDVFKVAMKHHPFGRSRLPELERRSRASLSGGLVESWE